MLIASFLLIFRALAPKNKKLRFFNEISIFLWHNLVIFLNFKKKYLKKKYHTKIKFREFFQKLQQHMAYNSYMGCRATLKHFFEEFFTHFCENQPKNWNFVEKLPGGPNFQFDPNSWQIVKNTQILYFYIALCQYFGYTSSENYWFFPESFKIAFYRDNWEFLSEKGPFWPFWALFRFLIQFFSKSRVN